MIESATSVYYRVVYELYYRILRHLTKNSDLRWIGFHTDCLRNAIEEGVRVHDLGFDEANELRKILTLFNELEVKELERLRVMTENLVYADQKNKSTD
jgi:hypothetical protein